MSKIANILWFIFFGFWIAIQYFIIGICNFLSLIFIPFGLQYFKLGKLAIRPFGKEIIRENNTKYLILNIVWAVLGGLVFSLGLFLAGAILCATVVGVPLGLQIFKLGKMAIAPFGAHFQEIQNGNINGSNGTINLLNSNNEGQVNLLNSSSQGIVNMLNDVATEVETSNNTFEMKEIKQTRQIESIQASDPISRLKFAAFFLKLFKKKKRENVFYAVSVCSDDEYKKIRTEYFKMGFFVPALIFIIALYSFIYFNVLYQVSRFSAIYELFSYYFCGLALAPVFTLVIDSCISRPIRKYQNYKKLLSILNINDEQLREMRLKDQISINNVKLGEVFYENSKFVVSDKAFLKKSTKNIYYFNGIIDYEIQDMNYHIECLSKNKKYTFTVKCRPGLFIYTDIPFAEIFYSKKYKLNTNKVNKIREGVENGK